MIKSYKNIKNQILKYDVFIQSLFLNVFCIFFFRLICEVHFDTDTDQFLNHILSGAYGENASAYGWLFLSFLTSSQIIFEPLLVLPDLLYCSILFANFTPWIMPNITFCSSAFKFISSNRFINSIISGFLSILNVSFILRSSSLIL